MARRSVQVGKISGNRGRINITTGDIVEHIQHIYERSLTAAEGKAKARSIEDKLLAKGVSSLLKQMRYTVEKPAMRSPYRGLLYYELSDVEMFFGRQQAIEDLLSVMNRSSFTILYSESGAGKTSLLQAGVIPRLIAGGNLPVYLRSNNRNPALAIKRIFSDDLREIPNLAKAPLGGFLQRVSEIVGPKTTIYLLLDQFEEFFIKTSEPDRRAFIDEFADCLDNSNLKVHWLISMRKEYFGHLGIFTTRIRNPYENYYFLNKLSREQACDVITQSAAEFKLSFETGLIDRILDDLGTEAIDPAELQLVCAGLYEENADQQNSLTIELYEKEGCATGILSDHLKRVLSRDIPPAQRTIARQLLEALVTSVPQRATRLHQELIDQFSSKKIAAEEIDVILNQLINSRLIRADETEDGLTYELVHDYLLEEIKLDPQTKQRKEAEELLQQGTENWRNHGVLLGRDAVELIDRQRKKLKPNPDEVQLFILSALEQKINPNPWRTFLDKEARLKIIEENAARLNEPDRRVQQRANTLLWFFAIDQPGPMRARYLVKEIPRRGIVEFLPLITKYMFLILLTALAFFVLTLASSVKVGLDGWRTVSSLNAQCLSGNQHGLLDASIDRNHRSNFLVYDRSNQRLCESMDAGSSWKNVELPPATEVVNIAAGNKRIFALSSHAIYYREFGSEQWEPLDPPITLQGEYVALSQNPQNRDEIVIASSTNELIVLKSSPAGWAAARINTDPISGQATGMTTDGTKIVMATTEGIWYSGYPDIVWHRMKNTLAQQHIHSIAIYENFFYAVTDDHRITTGDFDEESLLGPQVKGEYPIPQWPNSQDAVESLATSESVILVGNSSGLECYPAWNWLHQEWWRLMFFQNKPCQ